MTCEKAREISIFSVLNSMGFEPKRNKESEAWFLSPFRKEADASFKVSKTLNRWYDHGEGIGGNTLDFVIKYHNYSVKEALHFLGGNFSSLSFQQPLKEATQKVYKAEEHITIKNVRKLQNTALIDYLKERKVNVDLSKQFCKEVYYFLNGKINFSIGLENVSGGWELRNKYFRNSSSPKDFTYFESGQKTLKITEGIFDFLSLITIEPECLDNSDYIILNSISFKKSVLPLLSNYDQVELYLDSDNSGKKTTEYFLSNCSNCIDKSNLYEGFEDLNDWLKNNVNLLK